MKKLICLLLVLVLLVACFTCLAACGEDTDKKDDNKTPTDTNPPTIDDDFEGFVVPSYNLIA